MKRVFLFTVATLAVSCCGAIVGSIITLRFYRRFAHTVQVVITKRLEIVDDQGKTRATFDVSRDNTMLQMLSPAGRPMISLGILAQTKSRQSELNKAGIRGIDYPAPLFELDNDIDRSAIRMTTVRNGYGQMNFTSDQSAENSSSAITHRATLTMEPTTKAPGVLQSTAKREEQESA